MPSFFFFFMCQVTCLDEFRHHELGDNFKCIFGGSDRWGEKLGKDYCTEGEHLKNVSAREGQILCMNPLALAWAVNWGLRKQEAERKFTLGSRTGNFMSKGKWTKKIHTKPSIILLHCLKLHAVQCFAWCPLMGKGKQNASRDTLLNI